jgi:arginyl-tRNA synthetase
MRITHLIKQNIQKVLKEAFDVEIPLEDILVEHPKNPKWGDYATNVSMKLAPLIKQAPQEIAKTLCYGLQGCDQRFSFCDEKHRIFEKIESASGGFVNFRFSKEWLTNVPYQIIGGDGYYKTLEFANKKVLVEYTDPNPFKVFHIGHLMSNCIGESLSRLISASGAEVKRANYQGDVGMHVAKSIWGMRKKLAVEGLSLNDVESWDLGQRTNFLGQAYALGASAYKEDDHAQKEMKDINILVFVAAQEMLQEQEGWEPLVDYAQYLSSNNNDLDAIRELYNKGRLWSLEQFEKVYLRLGTKFDFYYFESLVGEVGFKLVKDYLEKGVFEENAGAIIFRGEQYGLHTRVFVNALGLPTYEAKDLGLAQKKHEDFAYDVSIMVTANEIDAYFKVVFKAMEAVLPDLVPKIRHISHGMMKLPSGKMSSRTGDIITGMSLLNEIKDAVLEKMELSDTNFLGGSKDAIAEKIAVGAIKYSILKQGIGRDIVFDKERSLSLTGNTGPYLQYAYVRACSILEKGGWISSMVTQQVDCSRRITEDEQLLLGSLHGFFESIEKASLNFAPNVLCEYLFDLAQRFNSLYASVPILDTQNEDLRLFRLTLVYGVATVLKDGLGLLGIEVVDKM